MAYENISGNMSSGVMAPAWRNKQWRISLKKKKKAIMAWRK